MAMKVCACARRAAPRAATVAVGMAKAANRPGSRPLGVIARPDGAVTGGTLRVMLMHHQCVARVARGAAYGGSRGQRGLGGRLFANVRHPRTHLTCVPARRAQRPASGRTFHYVTCAITFIASFAYLVMALHGGVACISTDGSAPPTALIFDSCDEQGKTDGTTYRAFYYARYCDWTVTTPLLLLDLCLLCGAPWSETFFLIVMDLIMVVAGLAGALFGGKAAHSNARWMGFAFGCLAFLPIVYVRSPP